MTELYEFSVEAMFEPIERLFEREYPTEYGIFDTEAELSNNKARHARVEMLYLAGGSQLLHALKILTSYDDCLFDVEYGIHSLSRARGNYIWLALPLDEFRDGEAEYNEILETTCVERGVGIITVQPRGRGLSAKIIHRAQKHDGEFLEDYGGLRKQWRELKDRNMAMDGYQVVDYYGR